MIKLSRLTQFIIYKHIYKRKPFFRTRIIRILHRQKQNMHYTYGRTMPSGVLLTARCTSPMLSATTVY